MQLAGNQEMGPSEGAWMGGGEFLARFTLRNDQRQTEGTWDFEAENPFRNLTVDRSFDRIGKEAALDFLESHHASGKQKAELSFKVSQTGDRDADDMDDFNISLVGAKLTGTGRVGSSSAGGGQTSFGTSGQSIPTPEPATVVLLGSGLAGLGVFGIRRRKKLSVTREL
jgi:hypothetical protein